MKRLHKDILTGLVFVTGVIEFISGDFIVSSALFAATTFASTMGSSRKKP
ncbi:hypothetical protein ACH5Y9_18825 [Methylomonas sp. BW4-1]|uniref:Uncharacterized protein n=2 Tax=Methylomonas TaxID=416 RepID=A0ABU4U969_9GAMM|nr:MULTISPECIES: hypothetical protein [Methylomonas]MBD9359127.1 hypothetical protein [Methylomonas fluvii]MDX8125728.1 hypothetical protein [Methylomonas sp. OY6]QSB01748.1 hypothetical protein JWZ98_01925 [Methylomonas sp. EFPC1]